MFGALLKDSAWKVGMDGWMDGWMDGRKLLGVWMDMGVIWKIEMGIEIESHMVLQEYECEIWICLCLCMCNPITSFKFTIVEMRFRIEKMGVGE